MANPEHLKILKQGVEAWNKWRGENRNIRPDLTGANLAFENLGHANLAFANLNGTNLLFAKLPEANLREASLRGTTLIKANLRDVNFREARFCSAHLFEANLSSADLYQTKLDDTKLYKAHLIGARLCEADLCRVDLSRANLTKANLKDTHLHYCSLVESNLTGAILTGAKIYGTARDNWIIKDIKCKYVYWDEWGEQRSPRDRDLEPGEFGRIYAALPTIEYIFENGMTPIDPLIMDRVVQAIREKSPEFDIKIDSINARGLAPSIKFTVQHKEHKEPALAEVQRGYDERINRLEAEKDRLYDLLGKAIDKDNVKLIAAGRDATVAMDSATINIEQHIHNALELQRAIADEPEESESFAKAAKKTALDIIGGGDKRYRQGASERGGKRNY